VLLDTLAGLARRSGGCCVGCCRRAVKILCIFNERRLINGLRRHPLHIPNPLPITIPIPIPNPEPIPIPIPSLIVRGGGRLVTGQEMLANMTSHSLSRWTFFHLASALTVSVSISVPVPVRDEFSQRRQSRNGSRKPSNKPTMPRGRVNRNVSRFDRTERRGVQDGVGVGDGASDNSRELHKNS